MLLLKKESLSHSVISAEGLGKRFSGMSSKSSYAVQIQDLSKGSLGCQRVLVQNFCRRRHHHVNLLLADQPTPVASTALPFVTSPAGHHIHW